MFQGTRAPVTQKIGYQCHGQRTILPLDPTGGIYRDGPDRCRETDKLRSQTHITTRAPTLIVRLVVELGAGSALPSLLAATLPKGRHASLVVVTEYPDLSIMDTLRGNVERARRQRGKPHPTVCHQDAEESEEKGRERCEIECIEYEWGSDVSQLLLS